MSATIFLVTFGAYLGSVSGQINLDLTIKIMDPNTKETSETRIPTTMSHIMFLSLCKSAGNEATVRINPKIGSAEIIDESTSLSIMSEGVASCMFSDSDDHVTCPYAKNFCQLNSACVAEIRSSCSPAKISSMHYVDVTLSTSDRRLVINNCLVLCEDENLQTSNSPGDGQGVSNLTIGLIVAGIILFATVLVAIAVFWKIRDSRLVREHHHKIHHIEYVK